MQQHLVSNKLHLKIARRRNISSTSHKAICEMHDTCRNMQVCGIKSHSATLNRNLGRNLEFGVSYHILVQTERCWVHEASDSRQLPSTSGGPRGDLRGETELPSTSGALREGSRLTSEHFGWTSGANFRALRVDIVWRPPTSGALREDLGGLQGGAKRVKSMCHTSLWMQNMVRGPDGADCGPKHVNGTICADA